MSGRSRLGVLRPVCTYRLAYHDWVLDLCAACVKDPPYTLGPVTIGSRLGLCDGCGRPPNPQAPKATERDDPRLGKGATW